MGRVAQSVQRLTTGWTVRGSNPGGGEIFTHPDRPWGPPSLPYNGYRVFPGGKVRPGRAAASSTADMEEQSYTSTHPLGHNRACNGDTSPFIYENERGGDIKKSIQTNTGTNKFRRYFLISDYSRSVFGWFYIVIRYNDIWQQILCILDGCSSSKVRIKLQNYPFGPRSVSV